MATNSGLGAVISNLIAAAKSDFESAALPLLAAFFASIAKNPTAVNIIAQLALLEAGLIAALPGIEQKVLADIAQYIGEEAAGLAAKVAPPAA